MRARLRSTAEPSASVGGGGELLDQTLERAVLFVASFFAELSVAEFDRLVRLCLDGQRHRYTTEKKRTKGKDGKEVIKTEEHEQDAVEYWQSVDKDLVLEACNLCRFEDDTGRHYLGFAQPKLRSVWRERLLRKRPSYVHDRLGQINESGLLFAGDISPQLMDNLIRSLVEAARAYPDRHDASWLIALVEASESWLPQVHVTEPELHTTPVETLVQRKYLELMKRHMAHRALFYSRFEKLCRALMKDDRTRGLVDAFLKQLLQCGAEASAIVLMMVQRLRDVAGFPYFEFLRRTLEVAQPKERVGIQSSLVRYAYDDDHFTEVLEQVHDWLPDANSRQGDTMAGKYALAFLFEHFKFSYDRFFHDRSKNPERQHPVLSAEILGSDQRRAARLEMLTEWLTHPGFRVGVQRVAKDHIKAMPQNARRELFDALLLDSEYQQWIEGVLDDELDLFDPNVATCEMLAGWSEMADRLRDQAAIDCVHELIARLSEQTGKSSKRSMRMYFKWKADSCLPRIEQLRLRPEHRDERAKLQMVKSERRRLLELRARF